uniref:Protein E6 n=1 Tax=Human papillomavirus TaxID=10566 RepID=A0A385PLH6_9PAPI|nr:MAG: E6 protein [Human papillomavirus]
MARPTSARELARYLGIPFVDLFLPCNFCQRFLSTLELLLFDHFELNLIWRDGQVNGCCYNCAKTASLVDFILFYESSFELDELEHIVGRPLLQIDLRCLLCSKKLSIGEKLDLVSKRERVHKIRNRWKAKCSLCSL